MFLIPFMMTVELVGPGIKTAAGNLIQVPFPLGEALAASIAIGVRDWREYQIWTSAPFFALLLLYFILPESPRWLLAQKKYKEFVKVIRQAEKINNVSEYLLLLESY